MWKWQDERKKLDGKGKIEGIEKPRMSTDDGSR